MREFKLGRLVRFYPYEQAHVTNAALTFERTEEFDKEIREYLKRYEIGTYYNCKVGTFNLELDNKITLEIDGISSNDIYITIWDNKVSIGTSMKTLGNLKAYFATVVTKLRKSTYLIYHPVENVLNHNCEIGVYEYTRVATIETTSKEMAFFKTQIDNEEYSKLGIRSTSVGDVIVEHGTPYFVLGTGFKECSVRVLQFIDWGNHI